jgi:hypothetical protein
MSGAGDSHRVRTDSGRTVDGMHPLSRRATLQTGLAAVGVLGAVAISLGLADNPQANAGVQGKTSPRTHASTSRSESDDHRPARSDSAPSSSPSVSAPQPSPPQATTSGS